MGYRESSYMAALGLNDGEDGGGGPTMEEVDKREFIYNTLGATLMSRKGALLQDIC